MAIRTKLNPMGARSLSATPPTPPTPTVYYTLTVNVVPDDAVCRLTYRDSSAGAIVTTTERTLIVKSGTSVSYTVTHDTYGSSSGTISMTSNKTLNCTGIVSDAGSVSKNFNYPNNEPYDDGTPPYAYASYSTVLYMIGGGTGNKSHPISYAIDGNVSTYAATLADPSTRGVEFIFNYYSSQLVKPKVATTCVLTSINILNSTSASYLPRSGTLSYSSYSGSSVKVLDWTTSSTAGQRWSISIPSDKRQLAYKWILAVDSVLVSNKVQTGNYAWYFAEIDFDGYYYPWKYQWSIYIS